MLGSIKIAIVLVILATGGVGYAYIHKLQNDLETARANVAKMEVAVATAEASIATLQQDLQLLLKIMEFLYMKM